MPYKSPIRPLCRCCGKPIPKYTTRVWFAPGRRGQPDTRREAPTSKAEVARLTNQAVMSVRWSRKGEYYADQIGHDYIYQASLWDGESYVDRYFCRTPCAISYAYTFAHGGHITLAYADALKKVS